MLKLLLVIMTILFCNMTNASIKFSNNAQYTPAKPWDMKIFYQILYNPYTNNPTWGPLTQEICSTCPTKGDAFGIGAQVTDNSFLAQNQQIWIKYVEAYDIYGNYIFTTYYSPQDHEQCYTGTNGDNFIFTPSTIPGAQDYIICSTLF